MSFLPLPTPTAADGTPRRTGIEIEFGGLDESRVCDAIAAELGGSVQGPDAGEYRVTGTEIGDFKVYLDTAYRDAAEGPLAKAGLDLARSVVPVEIVTAPLAQDRLPRLDDLLAILRDMGATGSRDGLLLGYGVHLNPQVAGETLDDILPVLRAYTLVEDILRGEDRVDPSRRLLPFIDAYPRRFVDRLVGEEIGSLGALIDLYLEETPTRNRGLDMLPLFAHLDKARVTAAMPDDSATSARPTYHYRLPDCRIDEPGWSVATEWNRWVLVERLAADPDTLSGLSREWLDHRASWTTVRADWARRAGSALRAAGHFEGVT